MTTMKVTFLLVSLVCFGPLEVLASPLCLAHRAEHVKNAENSLEGIKEALLLGADGVELDLRHTSDGVALGVHDFILWRVAKNKPERDCPLWTPIPWLTFAEIRDNCEFINSQQIPRLEEILQLTHDAKIFTLLQFKDDPSPATLQLIKSHFHWEKLRIHSHWDSSLERFENFATENNLPIKTLKISKYWPRVSDTRGNDIWWPFRWLLAQKPELRNRETGLFLVNSPEQIAAALKLNVNYLTTDVPHICKILTQRQ